MLGFDALGRLALGQEPNLAAYKLNITTGTYLVGGNTVGAYYGRKSNIVAGAYVITGNAVSLPRAYRVTIVLGTYAISGNAVAVKADRRLAITAGAYAISGNTVALPRTYRVAITAGAYLLNGNAIVAAVGRRLSIVTGSYALTGNPVNLPRTYQVSISLGTYLLNGNAVALAKSSAPPSLLVVDTHDGLGRTVEDLEPEPWHKPRELEAVRTTIERARRRIEGGHNLNPAQAATARTAIRNIERSVALSLPDPAAITSLLASLDAVATRLARAEQQAAIARLKQIEQELEDEHDAVMLLFAA